MITGSRRVSDYKQLMKELPTLRHVDPERVYINLPGERCPKYTVHVEKGAKVKLGEILGERDGGFFKQPIYSTVSGTVEGTTEKTDASGDKIECLVIKNDYQDTYHESITDRPDSVIADFKKKDFVEILKDKGLVGLGGAAFPSYIKLDTDKDIHTVVINAVECEPYLSSDYRLIKDQPEDIFKGLSYVMQAIEAARGVIAVKKTKRELIEVLEREQGRFADKDIRIAKLDDYYPQGWENATFEKAIGIKVDVGTLPMEKGILGFNVSTCAAIYEAVKHNLPVIKRHLTVNGDAVKFPQNIRARVGTSVKELIELCDGYRADAKAVEVILGGPMMGKSIPDDDAIVTQTTTSVLVFESTDHIEEPCVRCASCVYSCPVDIQPVSIMNAVKRNDEKAAQELRADRCIECGLCAYVCTSKIHVTDYVRKGKALTETK